MLSFLTMRRPDPTPRQKQRFITASQFRFRMEFVLEFDRPISVIRGREAARKVLDGLALAAPNADLPEEFAEANLRCSDLRRVLRITTGESGA